MGDILFTTNNEVLLRTHKPLPALDCQQRGAVKVESKTITEEMVAATNKRSFKSNVGSITNVGTAMLNLQANYKKDSKEWKELEYRTQCIQHFQQLVIDSVKNGFKMKPMNPKWNYLNACLPKDGDTENILRDKALNKPLCAYRKPFFMIYRYANEKAKYDTYVKQVDSKMKQKYGVSLDYILTSECLSDELAIEKKRFYDLCPVDMSPGTINRIAWAVNKKFEDFNNLPKMPFDKELIKSGAEYSKTDYFKVRDVYKEYRVMVKNLAIKTKSDEVSDEDGVTDKHVIDQMFRGKFYEACSNNKVLCDILVDMLYDQPNSKGVVWTMCEDVIIDNLLQKSNYTLEYPEVVDTDEEFSCCRKKFKMKKLYVGGDNYGEV